MKTPFNYILVILLLLTACGGHKKHITIAVLGDSLVAGFQIPAGDAFPAVLERKLRADGHDVTVLNEGISGNTTADGLARVDEVIAKKPNLVILELGANDMLSHLDAYGITQNLSQIIEKLQAAKIAVVLTGIRAPNHMGLEYSMGFNLIYPQLALKYSVPLYPNFLQSIAMNPKYNLQPDLFHPNAEGVKMLVDSIYPTVTQAIRALQ